jgi:hypothetical protein
MCDERHGRDTTPRRERREFKGASVARWLLRRERKEKWMMDEAKDYEGKPIRVGDRIELHPGCDLWMRGARFGTIERPSVAVADAWHVRLDNVPKRILTFKSDRLRTVRS